MSAAPLLLTLAHAADALSVSERTVRRLLDQGHLTPVRVGRSLRVAHRDLERYIDAQLLPRDNNDRAGPASPEESKCRSAPPPAQGSTVVPIRPSGGRATPTQAARELAARLERPTRTKPPHSSRNGPSKPARNGTGTSNRRGRMTK